MPAYLHWARQRARHLAHAAPETAPPPFEIEPLAVIKQVAVMFASACGPSFAADFPELARFILDRTRTGLAPGIRFHAYYVDARSSASRQSGITASLDLAGDARPRVFAEIAFAPVGYIMSVNSPPPSAALTDISFMADAAWGERRTLDLTIHAHQTHSVLPGDFRSEAEIEASFTTR